MTGEKVTSDTFLSPPAAGLLEACYLNRSVLLVLQTDNVSYQDFSKNVKASVELPNTTSNCFAACFICWQLLICPLINFLIIRVSDSQTKAQLLTEDLNEDT